MRWARLVEQGGASTGTERMRWAYWKNVFNGPAEAKSLKVN
jgi:hypothetical protein